MLRRKPSARPTLELALRSSEDWAIATRVARLHDTLGLSKQRLVFEKATVLVGEVRRKGAHQFVRGAVVLRILRNADRTRTRLNMHITTIDLVLEKLQGISEVSSLPDVFEDFAFAWERSGMRDEVSTVSDGIV